MRHKSKVDANQKEIVEALRKAGCSVFITSCVGSDFPDLVVGTTGRLPEWVKHNGSTVLMEIKTKDGKLSEGQQSFIRDFRGACVVVRSVEEALLAVGKEIKWSTEE